MNSTSRGLLLSLVPPPLRTLGGSYCEPGGKGAGDLRLPLKAFLALSIACNKKLGTRWELKVHNYFGGVYVKSCRFGIVC